MMSAAQGQPLLIGESGQVVRMHALHDEADERTAFVFRPEHSHTRQFDKPFRRISGQRRIMSKNRRTSDPFEIIDRGRKPDRARDIRRAGFEAMRRSLESTFLESDAHNHFAAPVPGRDRFQDRRPFHRLRHNRLRTGRRLPGACRAAWQRAP